MGCPYSRASGAKDALRGKKLMFAKDAASALREAQCALNCLVGNEIDLPAFGGFAIHVEDDSPVLGSSKKKPILTPRNSVMSLRRLVPTRFAPLSYFCTC